MLMESEKITHLFSNQYSIVDIGFVWMILLLLFLKPSEGDFILFAITKRTLFIDGLQNKMHSQRKRKNNQND